MESKKERKKSSSSFVNLSLNLTTQLHLNDGANENYLLNYTGDSKLDSRVSPSIPKETSKGRPEQSPRIKDKYRMKGTTSF
mmetsp:Transcript_15873/g.24432  ORF Transcript_15873/g.24432 Transcript_15873/m.24432 type:complete len:81 (+) Transcript_15873:1456-1698(+)